MSSNVQTQINDLNAAVQALDSSLTQITGNTMSNYNQLSRIVAQQANIYNTIYYGSGDMSTGNLYVSANALISGNLIIGTSNIISSGNLVIGRAANISGNLDVVGLASFKSGTTGILQTILAHQALPSAAIVEHTTPFPDDATRIVININGASTTSTTSMFVRVGTVSGTYQSTGYNGGVYTTANATDIVTDQIKLTNNHSAATNYYTIIELIKAGVSGSNDIWMYKQQTIGNTSGVGALALGSGVVTLTTGKLKYLSFNSGAGNFDAGNISILSC